MSVWRWFRRVVGLPFLILGAVVMDKRDVGEILTEVLEMLAEQDRYDAMRDAMGRLDKQKEMDL